MSKKKIIFPSELVDSIEVQKITLGADPVTNMQAATKQYVDAKVITANASDDDVVVLSGTNGTNSVAYSASHAKKGPSNGYTSGNTTTSISGSNASGTIKIPQITVDTYGHVTAAEDKDVSITMPTIPEALKNPGALTIGEKSYDGSSAVSVTASDLGIANALHFIGVTTTEITDNSTASSITIGDASHTAVAGDVVLYNDNEYVFDGDNWLELGDGSSHALKTVKITAGDGLTGGGTLASDVTISHADTSSQTNITANGRTYITGVTLDTYGHVTGLTTGSETVTDTTYTLGVNDTQGQVTFKASTDSEATSYTIKNLGSDGSPTFTSIAFTGTIAPTSSATATMIEAHTFNAKSDARLKENFEPLIIEKSILDLPTYKFDFINGAKNQVGCKAQDLQEICPEIVDENSDGYLSIQESKIVYLLLEEVKKLKAEIEILKRRG